MKDKKKNKQIVTGTKYPLYYNPYFQLQAFSLLLIITPLLMLMNYLQETIGYLSKVKIEIIEINIPVVLIIASIIILFFIISFLNSINLKNTLVWIAFFALWILGQNCTDYYYNHSFYELQHNWHYIAYSLYTMLFYRAMKLKGMPYNKIVLLTYFSTLAVSAFDEGFQLYVSNRVFDICDIAKDLWGSMLGQLIIFFIFEKNNLKDLKLRQKRIADYLNYPQSLIFHLFLSAFLLLILSSQLTEIEYLFFAVSIPYSICIILFLLIHITQFAFWKKIIIAFGIIITISIGYVIISNNEKGTEYLSTNSFLYKGIPIPYFDIMIFNDGTLRFVDKKESFSRRDLIRIYTLAEDVLLIGTGSAGQGGKGFPSTKAVQFVFNTIKMKPLQVVLLENRKAFIEYNKMKENGKNVVFIIHNS